METNLLKNKNGIVFSFPEQASPLVKSPLVRKLIRGMMRALFFWVALTRLKSFAKAWTALSRLRKKYQPLLGGMVINKIARIDNRYFWRIGAPGFPSAGSIMVIENELNKEYPFKKNKGLRTLFLAITKKCALNCEHCFEWDNLNQKETQNVADLQRIVLEYQAYGATQIMLSGGEPMNRFAAILGILETAQPGTDFWIITSGFKLNLDKAQQLKRAGLTGVMISLDHYLEAEHNRFRGYDKAYYCATNGAINAKHAGLVTALSLCATKSFCTDANLEAYMEMAKRLGVSFVQFLEPQASGRYRDKDVALSPSQIQLLERIYVTYNSSKKYIDFPIINYVGYIQRRAGCLSGGEQYMYIDTNGDAHLCPFCSGKIGNTLQFPVQEIMNLMSERTCRQF